MRPATINERILIAPVLPSILFGVGYGILGGLFNGWMYGLLSILGSTIFSLLIGSVLFYSVAGPVLKYMNHKKVRAPMRVVGVGIIVGFLVGVLMGYLVSWNIDINSDHAFWVLFTYVFMVLSGGCLVYAFSE